MATDMHATAQRIHRDIRVKANHTRKGQYTPRKAMLVHIVAVWPAPAPVNLYSGLAVGHDVAGQKD